MTEPEGKWLRKGSAANGEVASSESVICSGAEKKPNYYYMTKKETPTLKSGLVSKITTDTRH